MRGVFYHPLPHRLAHLTAATQIDAMAVSMNFDLDVGVFGFVLGCVGPF